MSERFYDHSAYLATQQQARPQWEALENDNPVVQVTRQALQPHEASQDAISVSQQGKQSDDAVLVARGTLIRSLPVIGLSLPLSICITALAWLSGIVTAGFLAYVVSVLGLWGAFSLACYARIAANDHKFSHYGTEHHKIDALTSIKQQELSQDYALKRAALDAYIRRLEGKTDGQ